MELFFDLVYVFAFTQLSDHLFGHLTARGAAETLVLFLAVWWAWNYTAWATNWIDPDRTPVAVVLLALMAISLVMSAAIPRAFGDRAGVFAGAYVALQVLRSAFMVWALRGQTMARNYAQLLAWSAIAGLAWIGGAFAHGDTRLWIWIAALALDLGAPMHGFRLPGVRATPIEAWTLAGAHLAERMQLVVMIALGESVLRVGATVSELPRIGAAGLIAASVGFIGTAALWAAYFIGHAELGARAITASPQQSARVGRGGYAYPHALMVAGVIVIAVAIRKTIEDPNGSVSTAVAWTMLAGPGLYLAGLALFKSVALHRRPVPPLIGIAALGALSAVATFSSRLVLATCTAVVLVVLALIQSS